MNSNILLTKLLQSALQLLFCLWKRTHRHSNARIWSNDELKKVTQLFTGDVINVSAGTDSDKEGSRYRNYFNNASSYSISNYVPALHGSNEYNEFILDLNNQITGESPLFEKFDVVFSHTVLEHVFDINIAVENLCKMSRDIIITVVPFIQAFHHEEIIYHDYWRISPFALTKLFRNLNCETVYINWNNDPIGNIYLLHIASKKPDNWNHIKEINKLNIYGPGYYHQKILDNNSKECQNGMIQNTDYYRKGN